VIVEQVKLSPNGDWARDLGECDCFWVAFSDRRRPVPLKSGALQFVDWKLHGTLSDYILKGSSRQTMTTFVPTMGKLPFPYLALEPKGAPDWDQFIKNCEGQRWKHLTLFCEDVDLARDLQTQLFKKDFGSEYPERLTLAADA
jgi:hypothetical protein